MESGGGMEGGEIVAWRVGGIVVWRVRGIVVWRVRGDSGMEGRIVVRRVEVLMWRGCSRCRCGIMWRGRGHSVEGDFRPLPVVTHG